jgi:predicted DNA-binding transcriptional regulator YafY
VTGHDHSRDGIRTFRLDRIASVCLLGPAQPPPKAFDPVSTVVAGIASVPWAHPVRVVLHAEPDAVAARLPRSAGTVEPHPGGTLLRTRAQRLDGMARMLAGLGWRFTVLEPDGLRTAVRRLADQLAADAAEMPEAPEVPEAPEMPEAPKAPEVPEVPAESSANPAAGKSAPV